MLINVEKRHYVAIISDIEKHIIDESTYSINYKTTYWCHRTRMLFYKKETSDTIS